MKGACLDTVECARQDGVVLDRRSWGDTGEMVLALT